MSRVPGHRGKQSASYAVFVVLPVVLLVGFAIGAGLALRVRPTGTHKVVVIHAFSGQLHDTGYDALAAVQTAIQQATDSRGLLGGVRIELVALDDTGTSEGALRQLESVANDGDVLGVLCCSSPSVTLVASRQAAGAFLSGKDVFPAAPTPTSATAQVASLLRVLRPARAVLVRSDPATDDPFADAIAQQAVPAATIDLDLGGGALDAYAARILAAHPDAVFLDVDVATASLLLARLRDVGYAGPAAGPNSLGRSEMVTWTGAGLGTFYVPVRAQPRFAAALEQPFTELRGHGPSDEDRLLYEAATSLLASKPSSAPNGGAHDDFVAAVMAPGQFPPHRLDAP